MELSIRKSTDADLDIFFLHQTDEEANHMAAFTPKDPHDKAAYLSKWRKLMQDPTINMQSILLGNKVIGSVVKYVMEGDAEITYAIGKEYWGQGLTTIAIKHFLEEERARPMYGRVAFDNFGSQRVLEKAGFKKIRQEEGFANARGMEIVEFVYRLEE